MARLIRHDADKPIRIELEDLPKDKPIFICACGLSKNFPFCDGSHKGTDFTPMKWTADQSKRVFFCCCKHTKGAPFCDGSHKSV